jgi:hypothetical protein
VWIWTRIADRVLSFISLSILRHYRFLELIANSIRIILVNLRPGVHSGFHVLVLIPTIFSLSLPLNTLSLNTLAVLDPLEPHTSPGGALITLGSSGTSLLGLVLMTFLFIFNLCLFFFHLPVCLVIGLLARLLTCSFARSLTCSPARLLALQPRHTGTHYDLLASQLETFSRPLWGLTSLLTGGSTYSRLPTWSSGLANGTDPEHDEYWGESRGKDQRMVEMSAIGFGLSMAGDEFLGVSFRMWSSGGWGR